MKSKPGTVGKEGKRMRLAIYLDPELHKAVRIRSIEEGVSATRLAERLLREYVGKPLKLKGRA